MTPTSTPPSTLHNTPLSPVRSGGISPWLTLSISTEGDCNSGKSEYMPFCCKDEVDDGACHWNRGKSVGMTD